MVITSGTTTARHRWRWVVTAGVVAVLLVVTTAAWLLPRRPPLRSDEVCGIDVSNHQGAVDWQAVAGDGIAFVDVESSEGGDSSDARFAENSAAERAGVQRGACHVFTLCRPGTEQAELDAFLTEVEAARGRPALLYVGEGWEGEHPVLDRPDRTWSVWQSSWWGSVDGVDGRVDLDVARLDALR